MYIVNKGWSTYEVIFLGFHDLFMFIKNYKFKYKYLKLEEKIFLMFFFTVLNYFIYFNYSLEC